MMLSEREKENKAEEQARATEFAEQVKKAAKRRSSWQATTGNGDLDTAIRSYIQTGFEDGVHWAENRVKQAVLLELAESLGRIQHPVYQRIAASLRDKAQGCE